LVDALFEGGEGVDEVGREWGGDSSLREHGARFSAARGHPEE
jgi:hypothetical protein